MSGWFLLASAIVQYQRKIKLLNLKKIKPCQRFEIEVFAKIVDVGKLNNYFHMETHLRYLAGFHCVKSVRIRSNSGPYFPAFGLNTERYCVKIRENTDLKNSECGNFSRRVPNTQIDKFSEIFRTVTEAHLGPSRTTMMEQF